MRNLLEKNPLGPDFSATSMDSPRPAFVIDVARIRANCAILQRLRAETGCRIVHALKAFALPQVFPLLRAYLDGCCASGPWEARLAHEHFGGEILTCAPAYQESDIEELLPITSHLDFNSPGQWIRFREAVTAHPRYRSGELRCGLRVNPRCSTGATALYDPCGPGSRLGTPPELAADADLDGLSGVHFHTLCEQGAADLERTLEALDDHFGRILRSPRIRWLNMGGGHWITQPGYDRALLAELIGRVREMYSLDEVWLEPGEAAVLHAGELHASVIDVFRNGDVNVAVLDISATAHMPDVLEMPYRPEVRLADGNRGGLPEGPGVAVRLGGSTCLAGDVIGDYTFPSRLEVGDQLVFGDMAPYTMVKTTFFNGVRHPDIVLQQENGDREVVRVFGYDDFKGRYIPRC
jgi:carboxynorspermidine decarboxylase